MRTVRITRQGFPNHGQHSWINYFKFILSKKYNVIIDPINPDIIILKIISTHIQDTYRLNLHNQIKTKNLFMYLVKLLTLEIVWNQMRINGQ